MPSEKIQVFIADDHQSVIDSFKTTLAQQEDLAFSGSAKDEHELLKRINDRVDVLLLDIILKEKTVFLSLIKEVLKKCPTLRILILSATEDLYFAQQTIEAGVRGYLAKSLSIRDIFSAIHDVFAYPNMTILKLPNPNTTESDLENVRSLITPREMQIISLLCKGFKNNEEIAEFLVKINRKEISPIVVQTHRRNIRYKLRDFGITNDTSLGYWIGRWDLLDGSELSSPNPNDTD